MLVGREKPVFFSVICNNAIAKIALFSDISHFFLIYTLKCHNIKWQNVMVV